MADQQTLNMTLVFVDIPGIGTIREQHGEDLARDCQQRCLALLGDVRKKHSGTLVRSIGGTLLCSFLEASDAVAAALGMQEAVATSGLTTQGIQIRLGLHTGIVHVRSGNYSGEAVTVAARMVTLAKPGSIVATEAVLVQAGDGLGRHFVRLTGEAAERLDLALFERVYPGPSGAGKPAGGEAAASSGKALTAPLRPRSTAVGLPVRKVELREVDPVPDSAVELTPEATVPTGARAPVATPSPAPATTSAPVFTPAVPSAVTPPAAGGGGLPHHRRLCLIWREKVLLVDDKTSVTIGRDAASDIAVQVTTASRHHADVCCRNGVFLLVDHSANGTFLYDAQGQERFAHQCDTRLAESGAICPGCPQEEPGCEAILYWMAE